MQRRFAILDVFAEQPMTGNQLGVVYDCEGLDTETMQAIAREFNVAETVFLSEAKENGHSAAVRIFTTNNEMPFAGHPTVGAAVAVAREQGVDQAGQGILMLEEKIGPVRCAVRFEDDDAYAEFDLPAIAKSAESAQSRAAVAAALSLDEADIGFENHVISKYNGGLLYDLVPVSGLDAAARAKPVAGLWQEAFGDRHHCCVYLYCRETVKHDSQFHARMFGPLDGFEEDPATGSAVASFAGAVAKFDDPPDGTQMVRVEQGFEMGRPSLITLEIEMEGGAFTGGRIGGPVVEFARGHIEA
ncbi:MAG: PhzF family phenazine biosynthesis protein [Rhizobiaceae bacterium]